MITCPLFLSFISVCQALCGASVRWSHHVNIEEVFGIWYGVGYAQHTPDLTNRPNYIGCIALYITEADGFLGWPDWTLPRRNYTKLNWMSNRNNPWSGTPLSGSWLDVRLKRQVQTRPQIHDRNLHRDKRDMNEDRRLKVVWDEDGQSMEQVYIYSPEEPGLWTAEKYRPLERELKSQGIDIWYPDDPPRHPEVVRILKVTPEMLLLNHCSDFGGGGIFTLILRRSPIPVDYWQWYDLQKQFYEFDLPNVYRKAAVCAACWPVMSMICLVSWAAAVRVL